MPLLFDMPEEKLYTYQGTNPRPADFDDYFFLTGLRVGNIFIAEITFSMDNNSFHSLPLYFD